MVNRLLIRPVQGLTIKDPRSGLPLPADRTTAVERNQFWLRRLEQGDVVEASAPVEKKKKVSSKKAADKEKPQAKLKESGAKNDDLI